VLGERAQHVEGRAEGADGLGGASVHVVVQTRGLRRERLTHRPLRRPVGQQHGAQRRADEARQVGPLARDLVLVEPVGAHAPARLDHPHLDVRHEPVEHQPAGQPHLHPRAEVRRRLALEHLRRDFPRGGGHDLGDGGGPTSGVQGPRR
jgi:hypothetical protein